MLRVIGRVCIMKNKWAFEECASLHIENHIGAYERIWRTLHSHVPSVAMEMKAKMPLNMHTHIHDMIAKLNIIMILLF